MRHERGGAFQVGSAKVAAHHLAAEFRYRLVADGYQLLGIVDERCHCAQGLAADEVDQAVDAVRCEGAHPRDDIAAGVVDERHADGFGQRPLGGAARADDSQATIASDLRGRNPDASSA